MLIWLISLEIRLVYLSLNVPIYFAVSLDSRDIPEFLKVDQDSLFLPSIYIIVSLFEYVVHESDEYAHGLIGIIFKHP